MINWIRLILIISVVTCIFYIRIEPANASLDEGWLYDASGYTRALELQRELKVPLIVYFYTDWCPYCRQLDTEYLPNPSVEEYLRGVVKVRINPENGPAEREIADRYDVRGFPQFYVIRNPSSVPRNLQPFRTGGILTPEQFARACQQVAPSSLQNMRSVSRTSQIAINVTTRNVRNSTRQKKGEVMLGPARPVIVTDATLPSLETVLQKYVDAIGGKDALAKLTTRVTKGRVDLIGVSRGGQMEGFMKAPNKSLTVLDMKPLGVTKHGFDGHAGWYFSNKVGLRNLKGPELAALTADADFYRDLRIRELYATTKLLGKTKSGFRELYVVQAVPRGGVAEYFYFDVETGLLFRRDTTRQTSEGTGRAEMYYGDWREVDGIRLPFSITQSMARMTFAFTVEEVKHNVPLEEAVFRRP
ncbi:MAG TPA: thioredoxin family protein [Pyrinomonadaceae bacterium]|nr:thioredoxin family protein [Pyrinomonadaceae bacterium]